MVQSVEALGTASPFCAIRHAERLPRTRRPRVTSPGQLSPNPSNVYVVQNLVNIASQKQHGWDLNVRYTLPWQNYGRFVINTEWAILKSVLPDFGSDRPRHRILWI